MFPPHLLQWRLLCFCSVKQVGKVGGCLQREVRDSQWRCDTADCRFFLCFSTHSLFCLRDITTLTSPFSYPDLCLCCAGNSALTVWLITWTSLQLCNQTWNYNILAGNMTNFTSASNLLLQCRRVVGFGKYHVNQICLLLPDIQIHTTRMMWVTLFHCNKRFEADVKFVIFPARML